MRSIKLLAKVMAGVPGSEVGSNAVAGGTAKSEAGLLSGQGGLCPLWPLAVKAHEAFKTILDGDVERL